MKIDLPVDVEKIIQKLNSNGHEAYAVGGCIRDVILGRSPEDWDITTSAMPDEVKEIFNRTVDTGIQHGTVTVLIGKIGYEVTTYRIDGEYEDSRRPKKVEFVNSLKEDLKRRDFTINAMAYNHEEGLIDKFGGIEDIRKKVVKCVGKPKERFKEDALRILRAVRFSAQLSFDIDLNTQEAIEKMAYRLKHISKERIQVEMDKLIMSDNPWKIRDAYQLGVMEYVMPEFSLMMKTEQNSVFHDRSVGEHTIKVLCNIKKNHFLRWAALLHDVGKPYVKTTDSEGRDHFYGHDEKGYLIAKKILRDLKFDNRTTDYVSRMVRIHNYKIGMNEASVRKSISVIGEDIYEYFLELRRADMEGKSSHAIIGSMEKYEYLQETYKIIKEKGDCLSLKDLTIKGHDLIELGIKPGRQMGEILNDLLNHVLENPNMNQKELLLDYIQKHIKIEI